MSWVILVCRCKLSALELGNSCMWGQMLSPTWKKHGVASGEKKLLEEMIRESIHSG